MAVAESTPMLRHDPIPNPLDVAREELEILAARVEHHLTALRVSAGERAEFHRMAASSYAAQISTVHDEWVELLKKTDHASTFLEGLIAGRNVADSLMIDGTARYELARANVIDRMRREGVG